MNKNNTKVKKKSKKDSTPTKVKKTPKITVTTETVKTAPKTTKPYVNRKTITQPDDYVAPKSFKFLGYCPKCQSIMSENDIPEGKIRIAVCVLCKTPTNISQLSKTRKLSDEDELKARQERHKELEEEWNTVFSPTSDVPEEYMPNLDDQM